MIANVGERRSVANRLTVRRGGGLWPDADITVYYEPSGTTRQLTWNPTNYTITKPDTLSAFFNSALL